MATVPIFESSQPTISDEEFIKPNKKAEANPRDFLKYTFRFGLLIFLAYSKVPSGELSSTNIISTLSKYLKILLIVSSITKASLYVDNIIDTFLTIIFF